MNIVLTGFMGTGKSTIGRLLATALSRPLFDVDAEIEREAGRPISAIFAAEGERFFRDLETATIRRLAALDRTIISTGGGAVLRAENMDALEETGIVVCLTASPAMIYERTRHSSDRPLLRVPDPLAKIRELLTARMPCYGRCHLMIDTDPLDPAAVVRTILTDPLVAGKVIP